MTCGEIFIQSIIFILINHIQRYREDELYLKRRHCHNLILIYGTWMCFAKFWPFYLRHQHIWRSGYVQWKKNKGFTQTSIYFDYLLGLNKIPCLLYEQLFIYTTIWFKRNILLGSLLFVMLICHVRTCVYQEANCIDW